MTIPYITDLLRYLVPPELPLQAKLLKYTSLGIILASLASISMNMTLGLPIQINFIIAISTFYVIFLFFKMPLDKDYPKTSLKLMLVSLLTVAFNWFPNGGLYSSAPHAFLLLVGFSAVTLNKKYLWVGIFCCVSTFCALVLLESLYPTWVTPLDPQSLQVKLDIIFIVVAVSYLMAWLISTIIQLNQKHYQKVQEASQAKSLFLSQLSHELRTPLNSVIGFSKILKGHTLTPAQLEYADRIHVNGLHLLALVNQIMDLSIIETNKVNLEWQHVNLIQLLKEVESVIMLEAQQKQLDFQLDLPENLNMLRVYTDPNRLRQIVINLINNAIKFTEMGHVICRLQETTDALFIEVEDTGSGIPVERQNAIFEPLFRLEKHHQIEGKGIGLSITQTLCEHLGYTIELLKSSDTGSTFRLTMPMSEETP